MSKTFGYIKNLSLQYRIIEYDRRTECNGANSVFVACLVFDIIMGGLSA